MMFLFLPFHYLIFLKVIGAASKEKLDVVKSMGASAVIDYNTDSIKDKVKIPGAPLTYFNDRGVRKIFLGLTFLPKGIFLGL